MRLCLQLLLLICCCASTALADASTKATLVLSASSAKSGDTILAGIRLEMAPNWHTYWKNSGDLPGADTRIKWELPDGITAGDTEWPLPEKTDTVGIFAYVYNDQVTLITPLKINHAPSGNVEIKAKVTWTECEKLCIQGKANLSAPLTIGTETAPTFDTPVLEAVRQKVPRPATNFTAQIAWEKEGGPDGRPFVIEWPTTATATDFYPYPSDDYEIAGGTDVKNAEGKAQLRKILKKIDEKADWPKQISGVLVENAGSPKAVGHEVTLQFAKSAGASAPPAVTPVIFNRPAAPVSFGFLLGKIFAAFLGGLILNIMPCVLPVIALKIFGFIQQSKEAPEKVFRLGLLYTFGVLVSFLVLAAMVIAVQRAGGAASWGMQMQYPHYRLALTIVATIVALNLFGVFEVTLGSRAMGAAGSLAAKSGGSGAFFNGVLATALATPCTAPFLAPAVGFAFAQPPYVIVLLFVAIALGLASPYLILSWRPGWLRFLPKPGSWMEKFKVAMGFPMLAAAVWLFSLTAPSFGEDGVFGLGVFLLLLALALWIWGEFVQRGVRHKGIAVLLALIVFVGGYAYGLEDLMQWRTPKHRAAASATSTDPNKIPWQIWSADAVEKARREGHPVLVDFTAKWCLTCEANRRTSIEVESVRQKLKEINAVALVADNTDPDPSIVAELKKYDRAGVPLVLVFPADTSKPAIVLPDGLFTAGTMLDALNKAAGK